MRIGSVYPARRGIQCGPGGPGDFVKIVPICYSPPMRLCVFPLAVLLSAALLPAQSFTPVRELKNLSPGALAKLHTLETLDALPAADWRFHAGDLPHGESPALDDSSWPLVHGISKAPKDA